MSSVSLTAIAVLENPRKDARGKTVTFDAQIYLGAYQPLAVEFRYFNTNETSFEEIGTYIVHGTVRQIYQSYFYHSPLIDYALYRLQSG